MNNVNGDNMKAKDAVVISEQVLRVILRDIPGELRERLIKENTQPLTPIVSKAFTDGGEDEPDYWGVRTFDNGDDYVNKIEI